VWSVEYYNGVNGSDRNRNQPLGTALPVSTVLETVTYRDRSRPPTLPPQVPRISDERQLPLRSVTTYFATSIAPSSRQILLMPFEGNGW
jgi:hypothetical protein